MKYNKKQNEIRCYLFCRLATNTVTKNVPAKYILLDVNVMTEYVYILYKYNRKLQRLNENYCNGVIDSDEFESKQLPILKKISKLSNQYKFEYRVQNDPRGSAIKLDLFNSGSCNYIGNDTEIIC